MSAITNLVPVLFVSLLVFPDSAFAYLDPGSGSIILQAIFGGIAGGIVLIKLYWHRLFGKKEEPDSTDNDNASHE